MANVILLKSLCFPPQVAICLQLNDPLQRECIVIILEGVVKGEEISGAFKLNPMELLLHYIPEPPMLGFIWLYSSLLLVSTN